MLSTFKHHPDIEEDITDKLDTFTYHWKAHIAELKRRCPGAVLVYIYGNHEWRILRYL